MHLGSGELYDPDLSVCVEAEHAQENVVRGINYVMNEILFVGIIKFYCKHQDRHPKSLLRLRICTFVTVIRKLHDVV